MVGISPNTRVREWHAFCKSVGRNPFIVGRDDVRPLGEGGGTTMLWTIALLLAVLWLLGMISSYTLGGFIHLLLLLAIAAVLIRVIQGRRPV